MNINCVYLFTNVISFYFMNICLRGEECGRVGLFPLFYMFANYFICYYCLSFMLYGFHFNIVTDMISYVGIRYA